MPRKRTAKPEPLKLYGVFKMKRSTLNLLHAYGREAASQSTAGDVTTATSARQRQVVHAVLSEVVAPFYDGHLPIDEDQKDADGVVIDDVAGTHWFNPETNKLEVKPAKK